MMLNKQNMQSFVSLVDLQFLKLCSPLFHTSTGELITVSQDTENQDNFKVEGGYLKCIEQNQKCVYKQIHLFNYV